MRGYNKVILMGNLTRDPELKYLPSQTAVAEFGLAMNRKWKTQDNQEREDVVFVDCSAFGKTAETINQYFAKGNPIMIEGRLKFDQWEDRQGGGKRSKLSVVIETFNFIGNRSDQGTDESSDQRRSGNDRVAAGREAAVSTYGRPQERPPASDPFAGGDQKFTDADIPF